MRYFRLYRAFVSNNLSRTMEFRAQFWLGVVGYLVWSGISLVFIEAIFGRVGAVRGWTRDEMWVLYGTFITLESLAYGLIGPNMWRFPGMIRDGGLDLVLTRPVATQFFVSTRYIDPNGVFNALPGLALLCVGLNKLGRWPSPLEWGLWFALLACGMLMAYCVWFFMVTWSVWFVKIESAAVAFDPVMQMARFPVQIYPQRLQPFLLTVLPVAFLTTFPTQALLGRSSWATLAAAVSLSALLLALCHAFFSFALRFYGSASS